MTTYVDGVVMDEMLCPPWGPLMRIASTNTMKRALESACVGETENQDVSRPTSVLSPPPDAAVKDPGGMAAPAPEIDLLSSNLPAR